MDFSKDLDEDGGKGDCSMYASQLYATIRSLPNSARSTASPRVLKVASQTNLPTIPETNERSILTERKKAQPQSPRNWDDGSIRMHSLSSNAQIVIPETNRNEPTLDTPRPRTAFVTPIRKSDSRPDTANSGYSQNSDTSFASTRASSLNNAMYAAIGPEGSSYSRTPTRSWISSGAGSNNNHSRGGGGGYSRALNTSCMMVNTMKSRVANEQEVKLQKKFQISTDDGNEDEDSSYNEWRVGMEDPTEESRNLHELSDMFYFIEQEGPQRISSSHNNVDNIYHYNLLFGRISEYISTFVRLPTPPGFFIQCHVTRIRKRIDGIFNPTYYMHLERNGVQKILLLTAKRKSNGLFKRHYVISTNPAEMSSKSKYCVGLLESNMAGSEFVLKTPEKPDYIDVLGENGSGGGSSGDESQEWEEFLGLKFEANALGIKGPRRLSVAVPKLKSNWQQGHPGSLAFPANDEDTDQMAIVKNRVPKWSGETCTYTLNFCSRVQRSSIKNFQLAYQDQDLDFTLLQFGRSSSDNSFILDFNYPFCPLQAFAIALSSFDIKWGMD